MCSADSFTHSQTFRQWPVCWTGPDSHSYSDLLYQIPCLSVKFKLTYSQCIYRCAAYLTTQSQHPRIKLQKSELFLVFFLCSSMFLQRERVTQRITAGGEAVWGRWAMVCPRPIFNAHVSQLRREEKTRDLRYKIDAQVGGVQSRCESHSWGIMQQNKQ